MRCTWPLLVVALLIAGCTSPPAGTEVPPKPETVSVAESRPEHVSHGAWTFRGEGDVAVHLEVAPGPACDARLSGTVVPDEAPLAIAWERGSNGAKILVTPSIHASAGAKGQEAEAPMLQEPFEIGIGSTLGGDEGVERAVLMLHGVGDGGGGPVVLRLEVVCEVPRDVWLRGAPDAVLVAAGTMDAETHISAYLGPELLRGATQAFVVSAEAEVWTGVEGGGSSELVLEGPEGRRDVRFALGPESFRLPPGSYMAYANHTDTPVRVGLVAAVLPWSEPGDAAALPFENA